jgi:CBS domain-containing protein/uncharacterized protein (DUF2267 family)
MLTANTLEKYCDKRMVVMSSGTSVYDAVRALESNHVGSIVVEEGRQVVGIVTDRDLALRVIGYELDASDLTLHDVMTTDVVTLPLTASETEAAQLMLDRHVRRIPILDAERVVGVVTLDDLILEAVDPKSLSDIVRAQLAEAAPLKDRGDVHPTTPVHGRNSGGISAEMRAQRRRRARAQRAHHLFIQGLMRAVGLDRPEMAEAAIEELLSGLIRRVTAAEADHLLAQLPEIVRERLWFVRRGPDRSVTRASIEQRLCERLDLDPARAADLVMRLGRALGSSAASGEVAHVYAQLPSEMRSIFANQ